MVNIPDVEGTYPVTAVMSLLKLTLTTSVEAVPVAEVVTNVAQAPLDIALVPSADVPDATV